VCRVGTELSTAASPPPFLPLIAHPLRWGLLRELSFSDRRVRELCVSSGERQSLVSYHLGRLRQVGLVSTRRSTADGRDTYYRLDLEGCRALLVQAGSALHPGLVPTATRREAQRPVDVLF